MRSAGRFITAIAIAVLAVSSARAVGGLTFDQLISVVFFEDEFAYADPTGYFCKFIALEGKDDFCKATLRTLDPKLCKVEVTREMQVTFDKGRGLEYWRSRDVFVLANLDVSKLKEPEVDYREGTSRQHFEAPLDVKWHEGQRYTIALDQMGGYKACIVLGIEKVIPEDDCKKAGLEPYAGSRKMALLFNSHNYGRAIDAIKALQKDHCTRGDEL